MACQDSLSQVKKSMSDGFLGFVTVVVRTPKKPKMSGLKKVRFFLQIRVPLFDMVIGRHQNGTY